MTYELNYIGKFMKSIPVPSKMKDEDRAVISDMLKERGYPEEASWIENSERTYRALKFYSSLVGQEAIKKLESGSDVHIHLQLSFETSTE